MALLSEVYGSYSGDIADNTDVLIHTDVPASRMLEVHGSDSGDIDGNADIPIHTDISASHVPEVHDPDSGDIDDTADFIHPDVPTFHVPEVRDSDSGHIDGNDDVPIQIEVLASDDGDDGKTEQPPDDPSTVHSSKCSEADVEALQARLRLVEQRFSGTFLVGPYVGYMLSLPRCVDVI
jgi:hypothetical protein